MSEPTKPEDVRDFTPEHYQAIGEFVMFYSLLESFFHKVFAKYAGLPKDTCRALIGGMRLKDVIERTKRLMKINEVDSKHVENFETIETLLNPLATFRDKLIHRVWLLDKENRPVLVNMSGAKSQAAIVEETIAAEDIQKNTVKILKLSLILGAHAIPDNQADEVWGEIIRILPEKDRALLSTLLEPFRAPSQPK